MNNHQNTKTGYSGMTLITWCQDCGASWTAKTVNIPPCKGVLQPEENGPKEKAYGWSKEGLKPGGIDSKNHCYKVTFDGRTVNAIGRNHMVELRIYGPPGLTKQELELACYSHYDHIHYFKIEN